MNSNAHPFNFDVNFGMGNESVFTDIDLQYSAVIPPPPGPNYFLELTGNPFLLLNNQELLLL